MKYIFYRFIFPPPPSSRAHLLLLFFHKSKQVLQKHHFIFVSDLMSKIMLTSLNGNHFLSFCFFSSSPDFSFFISNTSRHKYHFVFVPNSMSKKDKIVLVSSCVTKYRK